MHKRSLVAGATLCGLAVALGAFGAHSLKQILSPLFLEVFETAVRYQMYHGLALLITGILAEGYSNKWVRIAGNCFLAGAILFSGSLYVLSLAQAGPGSSLRMIGALTPVGGLFFISGWAALIAGIWRGTRD